jgi:hypothetical protein
MIGRGLNSMVGILNTHLLAKTYPTLLTAQYVRNKIQICPSSIHHLCSSSRAPEEEETFLRLLAVKFDSGSIEEKESYSQERATSSVRQHPACRPKRTRKKYHHSCPSQPCLMMSTVLICLMLATKII